MCHLVLLIPLIGLPVFWVMPLPAASLTYGALLIVSALLYFSLMKSMRMRPVTGMESLMGREAKVVSKSQFGRHTEYLVRLNGELWRAYSLHSLQPEQRVFIAGQDGIGLVVKEKDEDMADVGQDKIFS